MSETNGRPTKLNLWMAVHAFQAEAPALQKDKLNPAFKSKYLSLDALMEQVMPLLNKHGLIWLTAPNYIQVNGGPETKNVEPNLSYRLIHATSGEETSGTVPLLLSKRDAQGLGSAITYARRYALMAVLGLVADEDDDGNRASESNRGGRTVTAAPVQRTTATATPKQRGLILGKAGEKNLEPIELANIILAATESETRDFDSAEAAEAWLRKAMDRLPAKAVNPVLDGIERFVVPV